MSDWEIVTPGYSQQSHNTPALNGDWEIVTPGFGRQPKDEPADERGVFGEIGAALAEGTIGSAEMYARAGRVMGLDTTDTVNYLKDAKKDYGPSKEGEVWRSISQGIASTIQSITGGVPGMAAGLVGGPAGAVGGFALSAGTLFSLAEYDSFLEEADEMGIPREQVHDEAIISAIAEGGIEAATDLIGAKIFGLAAKKAITQPVKQGLMKALGRLGGKTAKLGAVEVPGEMLTSAIQSHERQEAGIPTPEPWEAAKQAVGPSAVQTMLMGPLAGGAQAMRRDQAADSDRIYVQEEKDAVVNSVKAGLESGEIKAEDVAQMVQSPEVQAMGIGDQLAALIAQPEQTAEPTKAEQWQAKINEDWEDITQQEVQAEEEAEEAYRKSPAYRQRVIREEMPDEARTPDSAMRKEAREKYGMPPETVEQPVSNVSLTEIEKKHGIELDEAHRAVVAKKEAELKEKYDEGTKELEALLAPSLQGGSRVAPERVQEGAKPVEVVSREAAPKAPTKTAEKVSAISTKGKSSKKQSGRQWARGNLDTFDASRQYPEHADKPHIKAQAMLQMAGTKLADLEVQGKRWVMSFGRKHGNTAKAEFWEGVKEEAFKIFKEAAPRKEEQAPVEEPKPVPTEVLKDYPELAKKAAPKPEKPAQKTVRVATAKDAKDLSTEELVQRVMAENPGQGPQSVYGRFVAARNLKPEIDAKEFREIFERVGANRHVVVEDRRFIPTHENKDGFKFQVTENQNGSFSFVGENGMIGKNPASLHQQWLKDMGIVETKVSPKPPVSKTEIADTKAPQDSGRKAVQKPIRFEVGKKLTKEQRKEVFRSVGDAYKDNNAPKESKGIDERTGEERYGYAYSPDSMYESDITGRKIRHYIVLPDGKRAHPTELFPEITQAEINRVFSEEKHRKKQREAHGDELERRARGVKTLNDANGKASAAGWAGQLGDSVLLKNKHGDLIRVVPENDIQILKERGYTEGARFVDGKRVSKAVQRVSAKKTITPKSEQKPVAESVAKKKTKKLYEGDYIKFKNDGGMEFYGDVSKVWDDNRIDVIPDGGRNPIPVRRQNILGLEKGGRLRERAEYTDKEEAKQKKSQEEYLARFDAEKQTLKPGSVFIKNKQYPFRKFRPIKRGKKNKGNYEVILPGNKKKIVKPEDIARFPEGAEKAASVLPKSEIAQRAQEQYAGWKGKPKKVEKKAEVVKEPKEPVDEIALEPGAAFPLAFKTTPRTYIPVNKAPKGKPKLWADGAIIEKGAPPKGATVEEGKGDGIDYDKAYDIFKSLSKVVKPKNELVTMESPLGEEGVSTSRSKFKQARATTKTGGSVFINPHYIGYFKSKYPDAKFYAHPKDIIPVAVVSNGKVVGGIQPMRGEKGGGIWRDYGTVKVPVSSSFAKRGKVPPRPRIGGVPKKKVIAKSVTAAIEKAKKTAEDNWYPLEKWEAEIRTAPSPAEFSRLRDKYGDKLDNTKWRGKNLTQLQEEIIALGPHKKRTGDLESVGYVELSPSDRKQTWSYSIINTTQALDAFAKALKGKQSAGVQLGEAVSHLKTLLKSEKGAITVEGSPEVFSSLMEVGRSVMQQGHAKWKAFRHHMKKTLGDMWDRVKRLVPRVFKAVKKALADETGAIKVEGARKAPKRAVETPKAKVKGNAKEAPRKMSPAAQAILDKVKVQGKTSHKKRSSVPGFITEKFGRHERSLGKATKEGIEAIKTKEWWDKAATKGLDKLNPIKTVLNERIYRLHRLETGFEATFAMFMRHGKLAFDKSGILTVDTKGQGFLPFMKGLGKDWNKFLYWTAARRAEKLDKEGREQWLDRETREEIFEWAGGRNNAKWEKAANELHKFNSNVLDIAEKSGLINKEARKVWEQEYYVPFYRIFEDEAQKQEFLTAPHKSKKFISAQIKKLKGADQKLGDPLENLLRSWMHLISESVRNVSRQEAFDFAVQTKSGLVDEVKRKDLNIYRRGTGKNKKTVYVTKKKGMDNVLAFQKNGKPVYFKVNSPELFEALSGLNVEKFNNVIMKILRAPKRALTYGATFGPAFRVANLLRDTLHTALISKSFKPFIDSTKGLAKAWREDSDYIAFMASGGGFGSSYVKADDPQTAQKYINRILKKEGKSGVSHILDTPRKMLDFWEKVGAASENAARVQLYSNLRKEGRSHLGAAFEARDLLDFTMSGASGTVQFLIQTVPFLNARMQGLYKLGKTATNTETRKNLLVRGMMLSAASLALWAIHKDDDEYKELEDWDRWAYYHFWVGNKHFRIPKPFEVGAIFSTFFTSAADSMIGHEDFQYFVNMLGHTFKETFAIGSPQAFVPIVEQWANKSSFTGRPIVGQRLKGLKPGEQKEPWTSESMQVAGRALGLSPKRAEELIRGYFSTVGMFALGITDIFVQNALDFPGTPTKKIGDYPMVGRFVKERAPARYTKYQTWFYDTFKEIDETFRTVNDLKRAGEQDRVKRLKQSGAKKLRFRKRFNRVAERLRKINVRVRRVMQDKTMASSEKRGKLDSLVAKRNRIVKQVYEKWYSVQ